MKRTFKLILAVLFGLLLVAKGYSFAEAMAGVPKKGEPENKMTDVYYIGANGDPRFCPSAIVVTPELTTWEDSWSTNWYVVTEDVTFDQPIDVRGSVNLILCSGARLTAKKGIMVLMDRAYDGDIIFEYSLTTYGQTNEEEDMGELYAGTTNGTDITCQESHAAIGGTGSDSAGNITINGGKILAIGNCSAGIGGGHSDYSGNITINGGSVTAMGGPERNNLGGGAGIGGGLNGEGGTIMITGGTVHAIGGFRSAGIGGGRSGNNNGGTVTISGGIVEATGGNGSGGTSGGAGIGGGERGSGGTVTISGGTVRATGGTYCAGIGGGMYGSGGTVDISRTCKVEATGGIGAPGIGGGMNGSGAAVTISGGVIETKGGRSYGYADEGAGISGNIAINGGKLTSTSIHGDLTLSWLRWTRKSIKVYADKYRGTATLEKGFQYMSDAISTKLLPQMITDSSILAGKTLKSFDGHSITVEGNSTITGTVTASTEYAETGERVVLNVVPGNGFELLSLGVYANEMRIDLDDDYAFTMPDTDVTVYAVFVLKSGVQLPDSQPSFATMQSAGSNSLSLSWTQTKSADGYDVFYKECGSDAYATVSLEGSDTLSCVLDQLRKGVCYQAYVRPWKLFDGEKNYSNHVSPEIHAYTNGGTRRITNPGSLKLKKKALTIRRGKSAKIKASVKRLSPCKRMVNHVRKLRFFSGDTSIATVTKSGYVKAVGMGTCEIYVMTTNGIWDVVEVTVTDA